jgi:saccharopine dehydrogenase-like NADP-dependent oxidoreductase
LSVFIFKGHKAMDILIIGAGAAGSVVAKKCALNRDVFSKIHLASRTLSKCAKVQAECASEITISEVDADDVSQVVALINQVKPELVINMALPYQDLPIMDACLATGVHYMDTANYEPKDEAKFCYKWQWDYKERFEKAGLTAILGCGCDPGVTNIFCASFIRFTISTLSTVTRAIMAKRLRPISTQKSISAKLPKKVSIGKMASGLKLMH